MHFFISGCPGILGPNSQEEKTGPGMQTLVGTLGHSESVPYPARTVDGVIISLTPPDLPSHRA